MLAAEEKEWDRREKWEWYLAQIAVTIERLFMKDPEKLQIADRLIDFGIEDMPKKTDEDEEEDEVGDGLFGNNETIDPTKMAWMAFLGIKPEVM